MTSPLRTLSLIVLFTIVPNSGYTHEIEGELRTWHRVTVTFDGPSSSESDEVNPFYDYRLLVEFTNGGRSISVPGFYAVDGNAAESSATEGNKWRVHFAPDQAGEWRFKASFRKGNGVAISDSPTAGEPISFAGKPGASASRPAINPILIFGERDDSTMSATVISDSRKRMISFLKPDRIAQRTFSLFRISTRRSPTIRKSSF